MKTFSIVSLAVCDARIRFMLVHIDEARCKSDSGICSNSSIGKCIGNNVFNFSQPKPIRNYRDKIILPQVFVANEGFALKPNMLRSYSRNNAFDEAKFVFSYRLSRARRVIENIFGVLASRFRIFRRPIIAHIATVVNITEACVVLHNFLVKQTINF